MLAKPLSCFQPEPCSLSSHGIGFSQPEGTCSNGTLIILEALGEAEAEAGLPARPYAQAGGVLERAIVRQGMDRQEFAIWNTVACRPLNNWLEGAPYEFSAISHCKVHMDQVVEKFRPRVIVALGGIALRTMTGWAGHKKSVSNVRGFLIDGSRYPGIPVMGSYHPAYIARGKSNVMGVLRHDLKTAVHFAKVGWARPRISSAWRPPIELLEKFERVAKEHPDWFLFYDIETKESLAGDESELRAVGGGRVQRKRAEEDVNPEAGVEEEEILAEPEPEVTRTVITQIQFSLWPPDANGHGAEQSLTVVMPFGGDYVRWARRLLLLSNPKGGWNNAGFDDPLLFEAEARFGSYPFDFMWQWHAAQPDLPRGLQYAISFFDPETEPWKHLADADPAGYGTKDVWELGLAIPRLTQSMKERGIWDCWRRHVHELNRILIKASRRGIPVNAEKQRALDLEITEAENLVFAELQGIYPEHLKGVQPPNGYTNDKIAEKQRLVALLDPGERWEQRDFAVVPKPPRPPKSPKVKPKAEESCRLRKRKEESDEQFQERVKAWRTANRRDQDLLETAGRHGTNAGGDVPGLPSGSDGTAVPAQHDGTGVGSPPDPSGPVPTLRWCRVQPFLPNSHKQVQAYIRWTGAAVPKSYKDDKETTGKEELKKLARKLENGRTAREREQGALIAPFVKKVLDYREFRKLRTTYIEGWRPDAQGLVHTTFTFAPATGQLSSRQPNVQNAPKRATLADAFRATIEARPGYKLVELDYTAYHALTLGFNAKDPHYMWLARRDVHSFIAGHMLRVDGHERWRGMVEREDEELVEILKWWKKQERLFNGKVFKWHRDERAKKCIAEGELVLTDKGLVPIEKITLEHRLWDGVDWVSHEGVVYQGEKEVITYDGLTATPDHQVVTQEGRIDSLGACSSRLARLETTGDQGEAVRTSYRDFLERSARERIHRSALPVFDLWNALLDQSVELGEGDHGRLSSLQPTEVQRSSVFHSSPAIRRAASSMRYAHQSSLSLLWRPGDSMSIPEPGRLCAMGAPEPSPSKLCWSGNRPNRQQWALRAGESSLSYSQGADSQSPEHGQGELPGELDSTFRVRLSLSPNLDLSARYPVQDDWGADYRAGETVGAQRAQGMPGTPPVARIARVYDIVNAGPRRCFTVSGKLVLNCILGIGFGLGAHKLWMMNEDSFSSKKDAQVVIDLVFHHFPKLRAFQDQIRELAYQQGFLRSAHGYIRWFWDVYHWQQVKSDYEPKWHEKVVVGRNGKKYKQVWGEDSEAAIAFLPANDAFGHKKERMLAMEQEGLLDKFGFVNDIHDALMFHCPDRLVEECLWKVSGHMEARSKVLVNEVAPEGLWCAVEASVGERWSEMKTVKVEVVAQ